MKVGIIGCGFAAHLHANGYKKLPEVEIACTADTDKTRVKKFSQEFNILKPYLDYREMFAKEKLDLVSICVPNFLHKEVFLEAAAKGIKNIACEKVSCWPNHGHHMEK